MFVTSDEYVPTILTEMKVLVNSKQKIKFYKSTVYFFINNY